MDKDIENEIDYYTNYVDKFKTGFNITDAGLAEAGFRSIGRLRDGEEPKFKPTEQEAEADTCTESPSVPSLFGSTDTGGPGKAQRNGAAFE
jgi:hypothetical protein